MKIVAWDERRFERDAQDLALIMRDYLDAGNQDRIYSEKGDCLVLAGTPKHLQCLSIDWPLREFHAMPIRHPKTTGKRRSIKNISP